MTISRTSMTGQTAHMAPLSWRFTSNHFEAMNTDIDLALYAPDPDLLVRRVRETFDYFDRLLSRFRPNSELTRLNLYAGPMFQASRDFFDAVQASLWAAQQTTGIYDPTILARLEEAGYDRTFSAVANQVSLGEENATGERHGLRGAGPQWEPTGFDYRCFDLDRFGGRISRPFGLRIDLGGMGKGWTVDRAVDFLCKQGHFLLNAGGDLYAYGGPSNGRGWEVHLAHPKHPHLDLATLIVNHHAIATSTTARRRWLVNGRLSHHLIDPRTGSPADSNVLSVSVIGKRVFTAEVYAKVALILGIDNGLAFLESLPGVEGVMYTTQDDIYLTSQMTSYLSRLDESGY